MQLSLGSNFFQGNEGYRYSQLYKKYLYTNYKNSEQNLQDAPSTFRDAEKKYYEFVKSKE